MVISGAEDTIAHVHAALQMKALKTNASAAVADTSAAAYIRTMNNNVEAVCNSTGSVVELRDVVAVFKKILQKMVEHQATSVQGCDTEGKEGVSWISSARNPACFLDADPFCRLRQCTPRLEDRVFTMPMCFICPLVCILPGFLSTD